MPYTKEEIYDDKVTAEIAVHVKEILNLLGEAPAREGLVKTPERVAKALQFITKGKDEDGVQIIRSAIFEEPYSQMVLVKDIELYSTCEHHMLPFTGKCHVAYIPNGKITGLSKIARVVETYARRLQVQERLTVQIRDCIEDALKPLGVAVVIEATHSCMTARGIRKPGAATKNAPSGRLSGSVSVSVPPARTSVRDAVPRVSWRVPNSAPSSIDTAEPIPSDRMHIPPFPAR